MIQKVKGTSFPDHCQLGTMYMKCKLLEVAWEQGEGVVNNVLIKYI